MRTAAEYEVAYTRACEEVKRTKKIYDELADDAPLEMVTRAREEIDEWVQQANKLEEMAEEARASWRARAKHKPVPLSGGGIARMSINEPDMYGLEGRSFLADLYAAQIKHDPGASERIARHQQYEMESRGIMSGTLGGIVPVQYLVELYAKASRNGRIFADAAFKPQELPDQGMNLIVPRLTQGTAAGIQASEGDVVTTQDVIEADENVPVRTIAAYVPVSRQSLERAAYSESILFEDLIARYQSVLDAQLWSGTGSAGQLLGVDNLAGVNAVYQGSTDMKTCWPKIAQLAGLINQQVGAIGYLADRIIMAPRRWAAFLATVDDSHRPLFIANEGGAFNIVGQGASTAYGRVGTLLGIPIYIAPSTPTNDGTNADSDIIVVTSSQANMLFERTGTDPVTLAFEQGQGNELVVQLIVYGYVGVSWRYPAAVGIIDGEGLQAPTFS